MTHRFIEEHREVRELLAPYAMNRVNDDERARIERHLSDCPSCRDELGHHEQVVGALALSPLPVEPSPDALSQLLAMPEIANGRQQGAAVPSAEQPEVASQPAAEAADLPVAAAASISHPPVRRVHQRARREFSWPRFAMPALAACCLALALVTGASLSKLSQVTNDRQSAIAAADDAKQQLRATRKSL
ncbi:MAG: zf-HC2 domain-containing protein, partial [Thermoleophilia bacterium]|nr:zf-HC2 domain-containing protein [Thermoleophilia bacterium]